jgi:cation transport regulator ChaC
VRAANHAAHHAPTGDPWNVYSRCGQLRELLAHTEQLVEVLADQAGRLNGTPGLYADDAREDVQRANRHAASAAAMLTSAAGHIGSAREQVNDAFSALSHLRVRPS